MQLASQIRRGIIMTELVSSKVFMQVRALLTLCQRKNSQLLQKNKQDIHFAFCCTQLASWNTTSGVGLGSRCSRQSACPFEQLSMLSKPLLKSIVVLKLQNTICSQYRFSPTTMSLCKLSSLTGQPLSLPGLRAGL